MVWKINESFGKTDFGGAVLVADLSKLVLALENSVQQSLLSFHAIQNEALPKFSEAYVRWDRLIAHYPQADGDLFGVHLDLTILRNLPFPCLQLDVAVETTFLDCHPMLEVLVHGKEHESHSTDGFADDETALPASMVVNETANLAPPILSIRNHGDSLAVMLPPRDWPMTGFRDDAGGCYYRLFEEFLEKGVIRKSRIWIVPLAPHGLGRPTLRTLQPLYRQLCGIPMPLTA